jgi:hypothetical protein
MAVGTTTALTALTVASLAASAVGTGMAYYGQQQQASNARRVAEYNAQIAAQNNRVNLALAQQQSAWQAQNATIRAQAQENNARALNDQARAAEAQGREEARRMRERNDKQLAMQRARYAKSGVTSEGSPLAIMAESAALLELGVQDVHYKSDLEARAYDRKAELERFEAGFSLFDAGVAQYESAAAETGFRLQRNKDKADYMAGMSQAQGYQNAAIGTLVSGAGDAIAIGTNYYRR